MIHPNQMHQMVVSQPPPPQQQGMSQQNSQRYVQTSLNYDFLLIMREKRKVPKIESKHKNSSGKVLEK